MISEGLEPSKAPGLNRQAVPFAMSPRYHCLGADEGTRTPKLRILSTQGIPNSLHVGIVLVWTEGLEPSKRPGLSRYAVPFAITPRPQ